MYIFTQWKNSLQLLQPRRLRLFLLVTLKTTLSAIKLLLQHFWWVYALLLLVEWVSPHFLHTRVVSLVSMILYYMLFYVSLLAMRPALERKDGDYFYRYLFSWQVVGLSTLWLLPSLIQVACQAMLYYSGLSTDVIPGVILGSAFFLACWPLIILSCFFMLDAPCQAASLTQSLSRAGRLVAQGLPIYLFFGLYLMSLHIISGPAQLWPISVVGHGFDPYANTLLASLIGWLFVSLEFLVRHSLTVFFLSSVCMYYLKIKYEQYAFLYGNQVKGTD